MLKRTALSLSVILLASTSPVSAAPKPLMASVHARSSVAQPAAQDSLKNLERAVARLAALSGGTVGVTAIHVETGRRVSINGAERFPMASVYKVPITLQLLRRVERGEVRLDDEVKLTPRDFRPGHSPLAAYANNSPITLTVGRLLELMLGESDNTASDAMLRVAGGATAVMARLRELGVRDIDVSRPESRLIMDYRGVRELPPESEWSLALFEKLSLDISPAESEAAAARFLNDPRDTSTPDAMAELLVRIHRREVLGAASIERALRIMTETATGPARLKGLLPLGTVVAHKTGTMGGTTNDVGIITLPDGAGHLAIAVFVKASTKEVPERERAIAEIARTIYDYFVAQPGGSTGAATRP